jgi:O-acetyl-ADP-ribose deacetylase (regulator of RNase III)
MVRIEFVLGDITLQQVDVVVNAANSGLLGGGGVDGAIHRAGGPAILAECAELRRTKYPSGLPTGRAVATTAGNLPATWVVHTVGPVYSPLKAQSALLASCYTESLRVAGELGATSIAFPAISTGVYAYPLEPAAAIAVRAVLEAPASSVELIRFVLFSERALGAFESAYRESA